MAQSRVRHPAGQGGFTLIELLVVIIIIGILAAVAVPQYFKVVERGRVVESDSFIGQAKTAQERYLARFGAYSDNMSKLDITFAGTCTTSGDCGMKFFKLTSVSETTTPCAGGGPGYKINLEREQSVAKQPAVYGASPYKVLYDRCLDKKTYPGCTACETDF